MSDTTAKIRAKGCETTGLTEELARRLFDGKAGKHFMAVVELEYVKPHGPDKEGKRSIDLVLVQVEPAPNQATEDHLRELTRSFHYERKLHSEDETLDLDSASDLEPKVSDVLAAGRALEPHEFAPTREGDKTICDVCGEDEDDARHSVDVLDEADEAAEALEEEANGKELQPTP